ncbi:Retrovirus-related Pol polyprotein, partial [Aphis craccivora]
MNTDKSFLSELLFVYNVTSQIAFNKKMNAEQYYNAKTEIKFFVEQIKRFSIIRLEGLTTLTCFERIRAMFRF